MSRHNETLRVIVNPNGFYPQVLIWEHRKLRVLCAETAGTFGLERRYRVRTKEGSYELGLNTGSGVWHVRRCPTWLERAWARMQQMPRYPLPAWRRRARKKPLVKDSVAAISREGGRHANRLALVRQ